MRLANGWLAAGLTLLIATTASAQSIAIPKPSKPAISSAVIQPPKSVASAQLSQPSASPWTTARLPAANAANGSAAYTYDSLGRLIQDAYPTNTASYTYDAAGNRTQAQVQ